tara:strand:+ start:1565 stop:2713 length:1149 start_codon:yes stop_codon:yes gene_type:complete
MGTKIFIVESVKDIQCIDFFIGIIKQLEDKDQKVTISIGPLTKAFLLKSYTFRYFLSKNNFLILSSYKLRDRSNFLYYFLLKLSYYQLFILSILFSRSNNSLKKIDSLWNKLSLKIKYKRIDKVWDKILIPWRKPFPALKEFLKSLDIQAKNKFILIPHSPLYDQNNFKDKHQYGIYAGLKRIYPHKNFNKYDSNLKNIISITEPNYSDLDNHKNTINININNKNLKILYLSQKISRVPVKEQKDFTFLPLSQTYKNIEDILSALADCSIKNFDFKIRIPLQMCFGKISHNDFKRYPIKLVSDGLLIDDIIDSDIVFCDYTSAMIYSLNTRPTRILNSGKLEYFCKIDLNIRKKLKPHRHLIINSVDKQVMDELLNLSKNNL